MRYNLLKSTKGLFLPDKNSSLNVQENQFIIVNYVNHSFLLIILFSIANYKKYKFKRRD